MLRPRRRAALCEDLCPAGLHAQCCCVIGRPRSCPRRLTEGHPGDKCDGIEHHRIGDATVVLEIGVHNAPTHTVCFQLGGLAFSLLVASIATRAKQLGSNDMPQLLAASASLAMRCGRDAV